MVRISTCCCSSCCWKSFRAKKTASSSRQFICHRLWGSNHSPEAGLPSHTAPKPWGEARRWRCVRVCVCPSVVTTARDATEPRGTPRLKRSGLRHDVRASMQLVTAMLKHPEIDAVHGTRDFSHCCSWRMCNKPRWHPAEAVTMSPSSIWKSFNWTELLCLKWPKWLPRVLTRGGLSSPRSQICYGLTRGDNALLHVDT